MVLLLAQEAVAHTSITRDVNAACK